MLNVNAGKGLHRPCDTVRVLIQCIVNLIATDTLYKSNPGIIHQSYPFTFRQQHSDTYAPYTAGQRDMKDKTGSQ